MLEVLKYIFSSAWIFFGVAVLILLVCDGIADIVRAWGKRANDK
jgi:hypothetical protein